MDNTNKEDIILVQETIEGNKDSFSKLIDKYKNLVFNIALRMLSNYADAEDVTQEVFIQAYKHLKELRVNTKFYSWIYTIAVNICKNRIRKKGKVEMVNIETDVEEEKHGVLENIEKDIIEKHESKKIISKILNFLPEKYRVVFFLRFIEDRPYEEISSITKLPLGTVKTYIHRSIEILTKKKNEIETF